MNNYNPIKIAHAFADAFGHGWVKYVTLAQAEEIFASTGGDLAATAVAVNAIVSAAEDAEELEGWQRCTGLRFDDDVGALAHETTSGRTCWFISANTTTIMITRPGDVVVASATLTAGRLDISWPGVADDAGPEAVLGLRHIEAMAVPLLALYRAGLLNVEQPAYVPLTPGCGLALQPLLAWSAAADAHLCAARAMVNSLLGEARDGGWVDAHLSDYSRDLARVAQDVIDDAARVALRRRLGLMETYPAVDR